MKLSSISSLGNFTRMLRHLLCLTLALSILMCPVGSTRTSFEHAGCSDDFEDTSPLRCRSAEPRRALVQAGVRKKALASGVTEIFSEQAVSGSLAPTASAAALEALASLEPFAAADAQTPTSDGDSGSGHSVGGHDGEWEHKRVGVTKGEHEVDWRLMPGADSSKAQLAPTSSAGIQSGTAQSAPTPSAGTDTGNAQLSTPTSFGGADSGMAQAPQTLSSDSDSGSGHSVGGHDGEWEHNRVGATGGEHEVDWRSLMPGAASSEVQSPLEAVQRSNTKSAGDHRPEEQHVDYGYQGEQQHADDHGLGDKKHNDWHEEGDWASMLPGEMGHHLSAWARKATDYVFSNCQQLPLDAAASLTLTLGMTVSKCFNYCEKRGGSKFFGLTRGHQCFCSKVPLGQVLSSDQCDVKCVGNPSESCGGVSNVASVYDMIGCVEPSEEEMYKAANEKMAKLSASYKILEGRSCGQSKINHVELDGSAVMAGEPMECAAACWDANGAESCHGFTYDEIMEKCSFVTDAADGDFERKEGLKCYFKKLQTDL